MIIRHPAHTRTARALPRRRGRTQPRGVQRPPEDRLAGAGHPHLAPIGWSIGRPIREFLREGPLPASEATAITLAVLSALAALHRGGRVHGGVSEDSVGVAADGWVRLAAAAARDDRRGQDGDLADTGVLLCRILGVPAAGHAPLPSSTEAERSAPALVAIARALAQPISAWSAEGAWSAVKDAAGYAGAEPQLVRALADLADQVEGASPIERAVTRVVVGAPLRAEPPPLPKEPLRLPGVDVRRLLQPRTVLPPLPDVKVSTPDLPRPGRRFAIAAISALGVGLLAGAIGGIHSALRPQPAAARAPGKPAHAVAPRTGAASPPGLYAQTPSAAVSTFFQLVQDQKLDEAALLWKPKMAAQVDLRSRFSGVSSIDLRRDDVLAEDDQIGIATVAVDWVETDADGTTHEYAGVIYTDTGPVLWRWDSWRVQEITSPSGSGGGGDNGDGG